MKKRREKKEERENKKEERKREDARYVAPTVLTNCSETGQR